LLPGDRDLDVGVWETAIPGVERVCATLSRRGYRVRTERYQGDVFNYTLMRRWSRSRLRLDIYVFRQARGHAWAPLITPRDRLVQGGPVRRVADVLVRRTLHGLWARAVRAVAADRWPWSWFFRLGTWWIPADLVATTIYDDALGGRRPAALEEYLAYRYGNWRVPVTAWHFWRDDGAVRQEAPATLLGRLRAE